MWIQQLGKQLPTRPLMKLVTKRLKVFLFLLIVNSVAFWYLRPYPEPDHVKRREHQLYSYEYLHSLGSLGALKPWPALPSYLPWCGNETGPPGTCEGYLGNGFTKRVELIEATSDPSEEVGSTETEGWFRCLFSETLRSSICEGGNVRMNLERISMSRGGEQMESVVGRSNDEEMPTFLDGAFDFKVSGESSGKQVMDQELLYQYIKEAAVPQHLRREFIQSFRTAGADEFYCAEWVEEPTLFVSRFEYFNLFHTCTDWYSAFVASRVLGLPGRPNIVFVDGHCKSPTMEEMWDALFTRVRYAKNFSSPVCFRHGIFIPLGYETAMFSNLNSGVNCDGTTAAELRRQPNDGKTTKLSEFGELVRAAFDFPVHGLNVSRTAPNMTILFIRRENYVAHPRTDGNLENRLNNEEEVFNSVKIWASNYTNCKLNVKNGQFGRMKMRDQIKAVLQARIIIGAHGAGMTHVMWALPDTVVVEIKISLYRRPHFQHISRWRGLEYHSIEPPGSEVNPQEVVDKLDEIVKGLGC